MGMLVGAYVIRFVPEVASWLIPGGVSSSAGSAAGSVVAGMAGTAKGYAAGVVTGAVGVAAAGATGGASLIGAAQQSHSDGGSGKRQVLRTVMSQTSIGQSYSRGADNARSMNNVGKSDSNYKPGGSS